MEGMQKAVVAYFEALSHYLLGGTGYNLNNPQTE